MQTNALSRRRLLWSRAFLYEHSGGGGGGGGVGQDHVCEIIADFLMSTSKVDF